MFGKLFDFNGDGKTDAFEFSLGISIMESMEDEDEVEEDEDRSEAIERLAALREELTALQEELADLERREPEDMLGDAYDRWEARKDLLDDQISDVELEIEDLEDELDLS